MNLYEFSQQNNREMGIFIDKSNESDKQVYEDAWKDISSILNNADDFAYKKVIDDKKGQNLHKEIIDKKKNEYKSKTFAKSTKYFSTSALSKTMGIPSKELFEIFGRKGWIKKNGKSWLLTPKGELQGGQVKEGQYGEYVAWPEEILEKI